MVSSQQSLLNLIENPTSSQFETQRRLIEETLSALLPLPATTLGRAMRYAVLGGGKRLRALMVLESAALFGVPEGYALRVAAAVEMVHSYSLVHDDLPAMDDADLRRGKPAVHLQFDEATAILAGDALLPLAFEVLVDPKTHPSGEVRLELMRSLSRVCGPEGLVIGQMRDLEREEKTETVEDLIRISHEKTGVLLGFSAEAGAILADAPLKTRENLRRFGELYGIAFQIQDDILDVEAPSEISGKTAGRDEALNKTTFVTLLGVDGARKKLNRILEEARAVVADE